MLSLVFEEQVKYTPDRIALFFENGQITYKELNCWANRLAHYLRRHLGVGPEVCVALCMESSFELVVSMLGILKAGGVYVPIDPSYPSYWLAFVLADARISALLTQKSMLSRMKEQDVQIICPDIDWDVINCESEENLECVAAADNAAYVIYTSGSTGRPKGVVGTHGATLNRFSWMWEAYPFATGEVCCQKTSLSFVDAVWETLGPLLGGCSCLLVAEAERKNLLALIRRLDQYNVTRIVLVPSLLRVLLESYPDLCQYLPRLKIWISSGEALPVELCQRFLNVMHECTLLNLYGSSEIAADATYFDTRSLTNDVTYVPIGHPIPNIEVFILDSDLQPMPPGMPGELYVGGVGLSRGYLERPDLTAENFVPHALNPAQPGVRLYRTGDYVCRHPDGMLEYLGRLDSQVKIRGTRIELSEIESTLKQHPAVRESVVLSKENETGDKGLIAYVMSGREPEQLARKHLQFSLFYFGDDDTTSTEDKYWLYLEGAKFADDHSFTAVWTPERHFHEIAGHYPNPSVLNAALAVLTKRIQLRAGSVVLPLHNPMRIAEEWAVVDNLSKGRVGISFTSGWVPGDFAFFPDHYAQKHEVMFSGIKDVQKLWRGETISARDGKGNDISLRVFPHPIQPELPIWLTCTEDPAMFRKAGEIGANVLTALLGQTIDEAADKIALYRRTLAQHGRDPQKGHVTMMLHTFIADSATEVIEQAREPFYRYIRSHLGLIKTVVRSLGLDIDLSTDSLLNNIASFAFERYMQTASLIGTTDQCLQVIQHLQEIGVDEVACLIDFGVSNDVVLKGLHALNALRERCERTASLPRIAREKSDSETFRQFLSQRLPNSMIPDRFVRLENIPLLPNGKVDRRLLLTMDKAESQRTAFEEPTTHMEKELATIWMEILSVEHVGIHDNFFELGGHSLQAMQMIARIYSYLGVELKVQEFFTVPTLSQMAQFLENAVLGQTGADKIDEMLDLLESMNDGEVQAMLAFDEEQNS
ncbi:MAG: LLM class flavin-dependent oxidoreductase [Ktedonobacteraceae bacterium]